MERGEEEKERERSRGPREEASGFLAGRPTLVSQFKFCQTSLTVDRARNKKKAERRTNEESGEWRKESNRSRAASQLAAATAALRQERLFFEVCIAYKCPVVKSEQHGPNESGC